MDFPLTTRPGRSGHLPIALLAALTAAVPLLAQDGTPPTEPVEATEAVEERPFTEIPVNPLTLQQEIRLTSESRPILAQCFTRASRRLLTRAEPEVIHVRLAFAFAQEAARLAPEQEVCWRLLLAVAGASDPENPEVRAAELEALTQIARLDPYDEVIRLRRLLLAVEQAQTVEDRLKRFEQLLAPESIELIGRPVAARLALDMALLLSRSGDTDAFALRLAQAVELDPAFPRATAMAAGYFGKDDPAAESELLIAALLADPTEVSFASQIGTIALSNGAYRGAVRMLRMALEVTRETGQFSDELTSQLALALWGLGRDSEALEVIASQMRELDAIERAVAREADPGLEPSALLEVRAPEPPRLSLLKAAILSGREDQQAYRTYVSEVMKNLLGLIETEDDSGFGADRDDPGVQQATLLLEAAAFAAWQGEDPELIDEFVSGARRQVDLTPEALGRFEAWSAIAQGRTELAIEILQHMEAEDELAALALSIAYLRSDRRSDAARIWLRLAREVPGTIIGIWSRNRLQELIGSPISPSELGATLDRQIAEIPTSFDRLLLGRDAPYALSLEPVASTVPPFAPVRYTLTFDNRSGISLPIGNEGPLLPTMALGTVTTASGGGGQTQSDLMVLSIDRRLAIKPNERLSIDIDLSYQPITEYAVVRAGEGFTLDSRAVTNFMSDGTMVVPGFFGTKATARLLRIDGVTADKPFFRDTQTLVGEMAGLDALNGLLLLLQASLRTGDENIAADTLAYRNMIFDTFIRQYRQLPAAARAWLAYAAPSEAQVSGYDAIRALIAADEDPLVQETLLAKLTWSARTGGSDNEELLRLADSTDPAIAAMAEDLVEVWKLAEQEEDRAIGGRD